MGKQEPERIPSWRMQEIFHGMMGNKDQLGGLAGKIRRRMPDESDKPLLTRRQILWGAAGTVALLALGAGATVYENGQEADEAVRLEKLRIDGKFAELKPGGSFDRSGLFIGPLEPISAPVATAIEQHIGVDNASPTQIDEFRWSHTVQVPGSLDTPLGLHELTPEEDSSFTDDTPFFAYIPTNQDGKKVTDIHVANLGNAPTAWTLSLDAENDQYVVKLSSGAWVSRAAKEAKESGRLHVPAGVSIPETVDIKEPEFFAPNRVVTKFAPDAPAPITSRPVILIRGK